MSEFPSADEARVVVQAIARANAAAKADEAAQAQFIERERIAGLVPAYEESFRHKIRKSISSAIERGLNEIKWEADRLDSKDYAAIARASETMMAELKTKGYQVKNRTHYAPQTRDPEDGMTFGPYVFAILEIGW